MKAMLVRNIFEDKDLFLDMFKSVVNVLKIEEIESYLALFYSYDNDEDIINILNALETELMGTIHAYLTLDEQEERIRKEIPIVLPLMEDLPPGVYYFKDVLLTAKEIKNKKECLSFITEGTGVNELFITEFAENDLNSSQAAKSMFIHRNTLLYKLNKLKAVSGFDLTHFKDAYILYSLVDTK